MVDHGTGPPAPKHRVKAKLRDDRCPATRTTRPGRWIVHDQLATGRKLRVLTSVDTFSRFSPALDVRFNLRGVDVAEVLARERGFTGAVCKKSPSRRRSVD